VVSGIAVAQTLPSPELPPDQPVTFDQAVKEAIAKNLDLAAQRWGVTVADALQITANLHPNPVLTVSGQTLNVFHTDYSSNSPLGPNALTIHTDFPFERAHKREERVNLAKQQKTLAELGVREVMRQVISGVQTAFVDIQQAKNNLSLAQDNLRTLEGVVSINEARLKSGDVAEVEVDQSRVASLQYRTSVQQAQLQLDQAKVQLQLLMGRKQRSANFDVIGDLRRDALMDSQVEIGQKAIVARPDYLLGQQSQAKSRADLRLQLANGKFDYTVGTEVTTQSAFGITGSSMGFTFSMPLQIFNKNQGEIARAQREISQSGAQIEALQTTIDSQVDTAYRQYVSSRQLLGNVETDLLAKARSVRDTTEYSYRRGEASLIEFLYAQRAFNDAMQTYNDARASYARSLYLIDTVSGATVSGS
jgi:cobalt-zinc-cadmium efflux system outer membrane protein